MSIFGAEVSGDITFRSASVSMIVMLDVRLIVRQQLSGDQSGLFVVDGAISVDKEPLMYKSASMMLKRSRSMVGMKRRAGHEDMVFQVARICGGTAKILTTKGRDVLRIADCFHAVLL